MEYGIDYIRRRKEDPGEIFGWRSSTIPPEEECGINQICCLCKTNCPSRMFYIEAEGPYCHNCLFSKKSMANRGKATTILIIG